MALGQNVKKFREAANLKQTELAELANMDQQALAALEKRDSKSSAFAPALAKALGKSLEELLGGNAPDKATADSSNSNLVNGDEIIELIVLFQQANPREKQFILDLARSTVDVNQAHWLRVGNDKP